MIEEVIDEQNPEEKPDFVLLSGDFNDTPDSECVKFLKTKYESAFLEAHKKEPDFTIFFEENNTFNFTKTLDFIFY